MATYCDECVVVRTNTWKGQLDFDRACTGPEQRCWLCTELTPWNRAMHELELELAELRPGKLRLRLIRHNSLFNAHRPTAAKTSFLASWLLQHHPCIDELKVTVGDQISSLIGTPPFPPFPIRLLPATGSDSRRTIRHLEVEANASWWGSARNRVAIHYQLKDLDVVDGLERLKLHLRAMPPELAAVLGRLVRRNASSIRRFEIAFMNVPHEVEDALQDLSSCESLTCYRLPSMQSVARLLHSSTALKELTVADIHSAVPIAALANELEINTSLKKLDVGMRDTGSLVAVFTALQVNTTLVELRLTSCRINEECGQALALLLQKNTGLRLLYIETYVSQSLLATLAAALTRNTTLESLHITSITLPMNGIAELCQVLRINKTLKKLRFTVVREFPIESRNTLARQLTQDDCYSRVELPWSEPDLPGLTAALISSSAVIEELYLPDICSLSVAGVKHLFGALASNNCVRALEVSIKEDPGEKGRALCEMVKVNRSITCLDLAIDKDEYKFFVEVLHALAENAGITKLTLMFGKVHKLETATALSYFLAHNEAATKFVVKLEAGFSAPSVEKAGISAQFVEECSRGMLQNKIMVKLRASQFIYYKESFPLFEGVRRNLAALNRAVDFVVSPSLDRQWAEGFELFNGRPCLLKHLRKVTGKGEPELLLAVAAAEHYLRDNYLFITGIVRDSVKCHPAEGTQVDALNKDCWLVIVRHLKVADVLS